MMDTALFGASGWKLSDWNMIAGILRIESRMQSFKL